MLYAIDQRHWLLTLQRCVKRCLSSGGLPLFAGYSKSKSSPSNLRLRKNGITELIKILLLLFDRSITVIIDVPKFHPPTANRVFNAALRSFKSFVLSYLRNITGDFLKIAISIIFVFLIRATDLQYLQSATFRWVKIYFWFYFKYHVLHSLTVLRRLLY